MVDRGGLVDGGRGVVDRGGLVDGGRGVVDRGGLVDGGRSVVDRGSLVDGGRDVSRGGLVDRGCRSMDSYSSLLISSVSVDALGSSMGLAADRSVSSSMRLVDSVADRGSVAVLDDLVVGLVAAHGGSVS